MHGNPGIIARLFGSYDEVVHAKLSIGLMISVFLAHNGVIWRPLSATTKLGDLPERLRRLRESESQHDLFTKS